MWETMPLLINTWLQRGKSPFPILACVIILSYLFPFSHPTIPPFLFSPNPFPYSYYALPFSAPLIPFLPLALPLIPRSLSIHAFEKFLHFSEAQRVVTGSASGREQSTQCISALFVVLSSSRRINTPATICLSLARPYFFQPPAWLYWSSM